MRHLAALRSLVVGALFSCADAADNQYSLGTSTWTSSGDDGNGISLTLFSSLERLSRVVNIAYCVGTSGISHPFVCASHCRDFPTFVLETTWNTGPLLTDSCGYIVLDHGRRGGGLDDDFTSDRPAIIVAFRGTYSLMNTIVDLTTVPQEYVHYPGPPACDPDHDHVEPSPPKCHNCTVHAGFMLSWTHARRIVVPHLVRLRQAYPDYQIHLVGHSLGGAVAALAALELRASLGWTPVIVTTFGEPRIGNAGLARFLNQVFSLGDIDRAGLTFRRVTHRDDPVPLLPIDDWGFCPHAGEIHISKIDLPPSPADLRFCNGDADPLCIAGPSDQLSPIHVYLRHQTHPQASRATIGDELVPHRWFPVRLNFSRIFTAHRDYFWRLGLCLPDGGPIMNE